MKFSCAIVAILALCLLAGCNSKSPWKEFSSTEGRFTVLLPGSAKEKSEESPYGQGTLTIHSCKLFREKEDETYRILYVDYPSSELERMGRNRVLDRAVQDVLSATLSEQLSKQEVSLNGVAGLEVKAKDATGKYLVFARVYLAGNRIYEVEVTCREKDLVSENVSKFLDSFQLTK
jgi:hypothetical protein